MTRQRLTAKQLRWIEAFLDETNPQTFLNRTQSAIVAGYDCKTKHSYENVGHANYKRFRPQILKALDHTLLGEDRLKIKLLQLLQGKKTIFQKMNGSVSDKKNIKIVAESDGEKDSETLIAIDVEDLELQRKTLEMAMKSKGMLKGDEPLANVDKIVVIQKF